ncbi:hypothetical protein ACFLYF_03890 [Chloroflexota bacterium]
MTGESIDWEKTERDKMAVEEDVREKIDEVGTRWEKVYFGGGTHFKNWLDQCRELLGEENIEVEEVDSAGLRCFEDTGEKLYRIWARADAKQNGSGGL